MEIFINSNYTKTGFTFSVSQLFVYFFRPYNLRRKSALRPSQSFDTMKSTTSSVVSDGDTMEAAASRTSTNSIPRKDSLSSSDDEKKVPAGPTGPPRIRYQISYDRNYQSLKVTVVQCQVSHITP